VAAVAIMAMLAFGVLLGSALRAPGVSSSGPLVLASAAPPAAAPAPKPAAGPAASEVVPPPSAAPAAPVASAPAAPPQAAPPTASKPPPFPEEPSLPAVKHVFEIVLTGHTYDQAFGPSSTAPYLSRTLTAQGELLSNYYSVAPASLANEVALISGQGPTPQTLANCPQFSDVAPGTVGDLGQVSGAGCVYPAPTQTLADQLTAKGDTWKAYVEDIGNSGTGEAKTCRHPGPAAVDPDQVARPGDAYVTWRNPFVYFHSTIDNPACASDDVGLDQLGVDLGSEATTPSLSYIVPNRCHDGGDDPCAPGAPAGLPAADGFLSTLIPQITASPAYKDGGLIAITFDQAPQTGPGADSSSCCGTPQYPNLPAAPVAPPTGPVQPNGGGGHVGLLLLSPFVKPGTVNQTGYYNHFSLLASVEDLFGLDRLGYASDTAVTAFDQTVFNNNTGKSPKSGAANGNFFRAIGFGG
jgi:hypothetical protein